MFQYGAGPGLSKWAAVLLWAAYVGLLVVEASDLDGQIVPHVLAAAIAYVMTLLVLVAMPRRSLTDLVIIPVALMLVPELVISATQHTFGVMRMLWELGAVIAALVPVKADRTLRGGRPASDEPMLGRITASASGRRPRIFDLWPQKPVRTAPPPLAASRATGPVHRLPGRNPVNEGE